MDFKGLNCWIITEGMAGTENQCIAVADALGAQYDIKRIGLKFPFYYLCPVILKAAPIWGITGIDFNAPCPDLIIASGRKAVPVTLALKKMAEQTGRSLKTIFIQNPKIPSKYFDLVAAPIHDNVKGNNVIHTHAAPTCVNETLLKKVKTESDLSHLPKTKIAVLVGGNSKSHTLPTDFAQILYQQLMPYMQSDQYGLMITASRRTPDDIRAELENLLHHDTCVFWDGTGHNPYHAYLANADYILVTEDSTSMLSDALSTGKPTYRIKMDGGSEKFNLLYQNLKRRCMLQIFEGTFKSSDYRPLNDAKKIADKIKTLFE